MPSISIVRLEGRALEDRLDDLAELRIRVFRDFPYLYDGTSEYEARYLRIYAATPGCIIVAAIDTDGRLVGAATALPLAGEPAHVREPLARADFAVEQVFYFGESVLLHGYRGQGLGVAFFAEREAHARQLGGFTDAVFCGVVRPAEHGRRPADYVPLDDFWRRRGYQQLTGVTCSFHWKDLDEPDESPKLMQFWRKRL